MTAVRKIAALALILAPLAACSTAEQAIRGPSLSPMGYPAPLVATEQPVMSMASVREPPPTAASANSLWRQGARAFFADQRAGRVGDILTVLITIDDSAVTSNSTNTSRSNTIAAGIPNLLGLESSLGRLLPGGFDPANAVSTNTDTKASGSGAVNRSEKINLTIAAMVTKVMPNGLLVIQGDQQVKTNNEMRELTISGIVRPEDITSANTIKNTQIAEARISYGGQGDISRVQKVPAGQSLVEQFSPF